MAQLIPPSKGSKRPIPPSSPNKIHASASKYLNLLKSLNQGNYHGSSNTSETSANEIDHKTDNYTTAIATTSAKRSYATSWILEKVRKSYRERLETFSRPSTYFAKPLDISPLVCARFGWINTAPNVLTCANNNINGTTRDKGREGHCCNAVLYVKFHATLSPRSHATLARTYRRLLAESHSESCPFRADAERWLILDNDSNDGSKILGDGRKEVTSSSSSFVPPYLLSMSPEFSVFEDYSSVGFIARGFVRKEATTLGIAMKIINLESVGVGDGNSVGSRMRRNIMWRVSAPNEVLDRVDVRVTSDAGDERLSSSREENATARQKLVQKKLMACLGPEKGEKLSHERDDVENNLEIAKTMEHNSEAHNQCCHVTKEAALLAVFGWRFEPWPSSSTSKVLRVRCRLCFASAPIPWCVKEENENKKINSIIPTGNSGDIPTIITTGNNIGASMETRQRPPLKKRRTTPLQLPQCDKDIDNDETGSSMVIGSRSTNAASFDVVSSHRHFCPYASGFSSYQQERGMGNTQDDTDGAVMISHTTEPTAGWKRVIDALMRPTLRLVEEKQTNDDNSTLEKQKIAREETFKVLRRTLQS